MTITRRDLISRTAATTAGVAVVGSVSTLLAANPAAGIADVSGGPGYGPLVADPKKLLDLPKGFRYTVLSRTGQQLLSGGAKVPSNCDGMAAFPGPGGEIRLVRNHENRVTAAGPVVGPKSHTYDPGGKGGTTTLAVKDGKLVGEWVSLAGSAVNCAGGPTPWHTWLTCEETEDKAGTNGYTKDHGWIFEVCSRDNARNAEPTPLKAMGRFAHEAVAVDPRSGIVYETEDAFEKPFGLFFRFLPKKPGGGYGSLRAGGRLEAMRVPGVKDLSVVQQAGTRFKVEWVKVPDPEAKTTPIRFQDFGKAGVTHSQKLEGAWYHRGQVYFTASFSRESLGSAKEHDGQVWKYTPATSTLELVLVFKRDPKDPVDATFQGPDNICMSPYGGLMICQDSDGENYLMSLDRRGKPFLFARNRQNIGTTEKPNFGEFAGVAFSPDGRTLYVNCYEPGTTFAITGPWKH